MENVSSIEIQLQDIQTLLRSQVLNSKVVLNLVELAEYTGFSIDYLYKLTHNQKIPFSKPSGKILFFEKSKIDQWLLSNPSKTIDEMQSNAANRLSKK